MKNKLQIAAALAAGVVALLLAGCAQEYTSTGRGVSVVHVDVDGTSVPCIVAEGGGIACDFDGGQ